MDHVQSDALYNEQPASRVATGRLREETLDFLEMQRERLLAQIPSRPWYFWECHNPWSRAARIVDSWGLLDLCQDTAILDMVTAIAGPDIILYDSQFSPAPLARRGRRRRN